MKAPAPPPAPDPREIARTDAEFNRIDQFTPGGSLTFSGPNRNVANLEFSPEVQANFEQQLGIDRNLLSSALRRQGFLNDRPIDLSQFGPIKSDIDQSNINFSGPQFGNLPGLNAPDFQGTIDQSGLPQIPSDINQFRGDVEQAVFDRGRALLDPVFQDQERALQQSLANRGLPEFGEASNKATDRFTQGRDRAFTDLANQATITGGAEASRALGDQLAAQGQGFGQRLAGGQFANQAGLLGLGANQDIRQQLFGEGIAGSQASNQASALNQALQQQLLQNQNAARVQGLSEAQNVRGNQFNELMSLLGMQQTQQPGLNNFFAPGNSNVTGAFGLNQQAQQNAFNAQNSRSNALLGGLFGLGGSIIGGPLGGAIGGSLFGGKPDPIRFTDQFNQGT